MLVQKIGYDNKFNTFINIYTFYTFFIYIYTFFMYFLCIFLCIIMSRTQVKNIGFLQKIYITKCIR